MLGLDARRWVAPAVQRACRRLAVRISWLQVRAHTCGSVQLAVAIGHCEGHTLASHMTEWGDALADTLRKDGGGGCGRDSPAAACHALAQLLRRWVGEAGVGRGRVV